MIPEPGDANRDITVTETFHLQTDDELADKELKQIEADDQAIQTIFLGLLEDIYAAVDREEGKLFNEWERFTSNEGELIESYYHRQDRQMQIVRGNGGNQLGSTQGKMQGIQLGIMNQIGNGNLVVARAEGNAAGKNGNQIRCYNCRGV
nr:hypothetical protein [Tanacetum cinerariifolium]